MTFVEIILFICAFILLYFLLRPLQHYFEPRLRRLFGVKPRANKNTVIDITQYTKKE